MMKKKIKTILLVILLAAGLSAAVTEIVTFAVFRYDFMLLKEIEMVTFEDIPCRMNIPVRYLDRRYQPIRGKRIYASDGRRFILRRENTGKYTIAISRWELGGLAVFEARYEITSPEILRTLLQMDREPATDPEKLFQMNQNTP